MHMMSIDVVCSLLLESLQLICCTNIFKMNLVKIGLLSLFLLVGGINSKITAQTYQLNEKESHVKWHGKKIGGAHYGYIRFKSATLNATDGVITGGEFILDMNTIEDEDLDSKEWGVKLVDHLKSEDFFDVEKYPTAVYKLKRAKKRSGCIYSFTGELTIRDVTRPYSFLANVRRLNGQYFASGKMVIDRSDYNVKFGSGKFFENLGDKLIYDDIKLEFRIMLRP
ncbi:YceI family protein [Puteibacter caeruleilacunae]|nr:YceI family protein [Puteibacter caeruleilacunae]